VQSLFVYNFNLGQLIVMCLARFVWRIPVILDVEDVAVPRLSDWSRRSETRPVQQLSLWFSMLIATRICDGAIAPTRRFLRVLRDRTPRLLVTGCSKVAAPGNRAGRRAHGKPLRVFLSGKLSPEHGIEVFLEAFALITNDAAWRDRLEFHVCGFPGSARVTADLCAAADKGLVYHGEVGNDEYQDLLARADVCLVLQDPQGRYGDLKTPSKAYEYLSAGKAVIATRIGDLEELPGDVITLCDLRVDALRDALIEFARTPDRSLVQGDAAKRYACSTFGYEAVGRALSEFVRLLRSPSAIDHP